MMAAILNSANLLSAILVFPLKLTHTCQDWFPPFAQKQLHSFILTQLDDAQPSYILPCWIQTPCFLSEIHSKALHFMMVAILNSAIFNLAILDSAILVFHSNSLTLAKIVSHHIDKSNLSHWFWLNLVMAAI